MLEFSELPMDPPYFKHQLLFLPLNHNIFFGPQEVCGINLSLHFLPTALEHVFVALSVLSVDFVFEIAGKQIGGVIS